MEYDNEENGLIAVPAPEFGAIFMSNIATKRACFKHKVFALPSSMTNFVKEVKKGMILFLFEYERRQLFGVYRATSDGGINIVPHAFTGFGKQFSAQVRIMPIWSCSPLSENEFGDAIRENYFSAKKFHFGLSDEQVHRLLRLFSSRKLKNKLSPRKPLTGFNNQGDEDHIGGFDIKPPDVDLLPSPTRGNARSFRGVERVNDDIYLLEHGVEDEDNIDSAEYVYNNDKKRRIGLDGRLSRDNATKDRIHVHQLSEELGSPRDDWSSLNDRVKREHIINTNYFPVTSNYMGHSDLGRTADATLDSSFSLGRSNEHNRKLSDSDGVALGTGYAGYLRINADKAHLLDNSHEPALSRKKNSVPFGNIKTVRDWQNSSDARGGKESHLDRGVNSTSVPELFENPPYNLKGICNDGQLFRGKMSEDVSRFRVGLGKDLDHLAAANDVRFLASRKVENEKCAHSFLIPAASNDNSAYAGVVSRQVAEVGSYSMNDFTGLVPGTENLQRTLASGECNTYSPTMKRATGYFSKLVEADFPQSTVAQNLVPSRSKFHDATITRVMPYNHEFPSTYGIHNPTHEVERGANFMQKHSSYNVNSENYFASSKGVSAPEFTKRVQEPTAENGKRVPFPSHDEFRAPFLQAASITQHFTRDDISKGPFSDNYQSADEELVNEHVMWQGNNETIDGSRSYSPNTGWVFHQGNVLTNLDQANSPGADIVDDQYASDISADTVPYDSKISRRSVFSRLSLAPKVPVSSEREANHGMSSDENDMDSTVDEIMDMLYRDQNIVPRKTLKRKPFAQKVGYGETKVPGKHPTAVKNNPEHRDDSNIRFLIKEANEVPDETVNHVLAETRVVNFKCRRETNRASEDTDTKFSRAEKTNTNAEKNVQNAQENCSEAEMAKNSADKSSKRRKLVRPVFSENKSSSDVNHQLEISDLSEVQSAQ